MDDKTPDTTSKDDAAARTPRFIAHDQMQHIESIAARPLPSLRERGFVRHDGCWWVRDRDGYHEVTVAAQNEKLDLWRKRLNDGALWT